MTMLVFDDCQEPNDPGLHEAIATNNLHKVKELLLNGVDFKYIGNWACTVLESATELGFLDIVNTLLETGVNPNFGVNQSPLNLAAEAGRVDIAQALINGGADINLDLYGNTALMEATSNGHFEMVKFLIENGANINALREDGASALSLSASLGYQEVFDYLAPKSSIEIQRQAIEELPDGLLYRSRKDNTLTENFIFASGEGRVDVVTEAISAGVDIDAIDSVGNTALCFAAYWGKVDVVRLLVEAGANLEVKDEQDGSTPLVGAIHLGNQEVVKFLIEAGANVHVLYKGKTTLMLAIERAFQPRQTIAALFPGNSFHHIEIVQYLIKAGVDINFKNDEGKTALNIAKQQGKTEIIQILIEAGARED